MHSPGLERECMMSMYYSFRNYLINFLLMRMSNPTYPTEGPYNAQHFYKSFEALDILEMLWVILHCWSLFPTFRAQVSLDNELQLCKAADPAVNRVSTPGFSLHGDHRSVFTESCHSEWKEGPEQQKIALDGTSMMTHREPAIQSKKMRKGTESEVSCVGFLLGRG